MSYRQLFLSRSLKSKFPDTIIFEDHYRIYMIYTGQDSGGRDYRILQSGVGAKFLKEIPKKGWMFLGTVTYVQELEPNDGLRRFMLCICKSTECKIGKTKQSLAETFGYHIRDTMSGIMDADKTDLPVPNPTTNINTPQELT